MEGDQLKLLEERIGKAIDFIEKLKSREKLHIEEKEELQERADSLEEEMKEKNDTIEELKESQVFLKEKIETILGKLESWADMVDVGGYDLNTVPEPEGAAAASQSGNSIDVTETVPEEQEPAEEIDTALKDSSQETSEEDPGESLFDTGDGEESADQTHEDEEGSDDDDLKNKWPDSGSIDES
jgi:FtsZ-binding cell division protein ZapB